MVPPKHVLLPQRRFLPASSSSSTNPAGLSSVRRNPFHGSRSTQPPLPSSSFNATPRFQFATPRIKDDIQTSFEDEIDTPLPPRGRDAIDSRDTIDAGDDDEHASSPLYSKRVEAEQPSFQHTEYESSPLQQRQRPFDHASKRRKVLHTPANVAEPISVSSPLGGDEFDDEQNQLEFESVASQSDLEDDLGLSIRRTTNKESSRFTHFRSLAAELVEPSPVLKASFRTEVEEISPGQGAGGPALPEIFTPSRRRGKRDYMPGGSADLVRSWILAIPAQESHSQSLSEEILSVDKVRNDNSGRFWVAMDKEGSQWLLPEQQETPGSVLKQSLSTVHPGTQILVKGQATKWNLEFYGPSTMTVAAYWEVVSPGYVA